MGPRLSPMNVSPCTKMIVLALGDQAGSSDASSIGVSESLTTPPLVAIATCAQPWFVAVVHVDGTATATSVPAGFHDGAPAATPMAGVLTRPPPSPTNATTRLPAALPGATKPTF